MAEPNYSDIIQRILDILQADKLFKKKILEFRFGELPEQTNANNFPACYVTTSNNPEVKREAIGPSTSLHSFPSYKIISEFWIVLVSSPNTTPADAQKQIYALKSDVIAILSTNKQLRKLSKTTPPEKIDPLCSSINIHSQPRYTKQKGKIIDSITIVIRTINFTKSPESL